MIGEITLPAGAELVSGKMRDIAGELEGRAYKHTLMSFWTDTTPTADRLKFEWVVNVAHCAAGERCVEVVARHDKAGTVRTSVLLA